MRQAYVTHMVTHICETLTLVTHMILTYDNHIQDVPDMSFSQGVVVLEIGYPS